MSFSKELKVLMHENNLTQSALAKAIGFSQRAVSKWINSECEPTETAIVACAEYFEISVDEMLGTTTPNNRGLVKSFDRNESQLLSSYRKLSDKNKARILAYIQFVSEEKQ